MTLPKVACTPGPSGSVLADQFVGEAQLPPAALFQTPIWALESFPSTNCSPMPEPGWVVVRSNRNCTSRLAPFRPAF